MMTEVQVHTVARQMLEQHGFAAIAKAAEQARACEGRGEAERVASHRGRDEDHPRSAPELTLPRVQRSPRSAPCGEVRFCVCGWERSPVSLQGSGSHEPSGAC